MLYKPAYSPALQLREESCCTEGQTLIRHLYRRIKYETAT